MDEYFYNFDERTPSEISQCNELAEKIHRYNIYFFSIQTTSKKNYKYKASEIIKEDLGQGWYANITDNCLKTDYTIMTIHGAPGDHRQWAGLQTELNGAYRWVNFLVPGLDGQDERRGNYSGSIEDISQMIIKVLAKRKIQKMVFCNHSMGTFVASYFIDKYPQYVHGYINITGILNMWSIGIMTFYRCIKGQCKQATNQEQLFQLLNKDSFRLKNHAKFVQDTSEIFFEAVKFPKMKVTQLCAVLKFFSSIPGGFSKLFSLNKNINILRVFIYGRNDPLHAVSTISEQIYSVTKEDSNYYKNSKNQRLLKNFEFQKQLQKTIYSSHGLKLDANRIQQYFCYIFNETGHSAHKRRPKQISKIIKVYTQTIKVIQKYQLILDSKM